MAVLKNRAKMSTSTTGTGTITLGSAEDGYQTFADAGVANADVVRYVIEDGSNFEIGTGTYTATGTTLSRTVSESSNSNNAINLSGSATVFISAIDDDIAGGPRGVTFNDNVKITLGDGTDGELYSDGSKVILESASSEFVNTDDGAVGPQFYLNHSTSSPATTDYNGLFGFKTTDLGNNSVTPFYISAHTPDVTSGAATGQAKFLVKDDGLSYPIEYFRIDGDAENVGTFKPIKFYEDEINGNQGVVLQGPSSIGGSDVTFTLPSADGSSGQFLKTDGSGNLSFAAASIPNFVASTGTATAPNDNVSISIGGQAVASGTNSISLQRANSSGTDSIAAIIGNTTTSYGAQGGNAISIGALSKATALAGTAVGYGATSTHVAASAFGTSATTTASNQIALGGSGITARISGAYNLPTSDGTNGQVLTTDGSGAVTFADAGGGGGDPDLYSDSANASAVTPTSNAGGSYNSVAIGNGADIGSGRGDSIAIGTDALTNQSQALAIGRSATVNSSGTWGTAVGRNSVVNGQSAVALGNSYSAGTGSFAAVIDNNTSSYGAGGYSNIAMGVNAKAVSNSSTVAIGANTIASGNFAVAVGANCQATNSSSAFGINSDATGSYSLVLGTTNLASQFYSVAIGNNAKSEIKGKFAYASGRFEINGDNQAGTFILRNASTSATAVVLTSDGSASADTINQIILPNNSAYAFHGTIVARQQASGGTACAAWKVEGLIRREGSAGTTVLVNSATTVLDNTPSWGMALSADTTNGGLAITVTGAASTNIRWVATIHTSEVTYA